MILVFLPLLFPNGHLLTRRWRIVFWLAALVSLVLRFIHARERERQQIKWLTYGTVGAVIMVVLTEGGIFFSQDPNSPAYGVIFDLAILCLPLSIGISILRNQLYDIDRLINRTLVYGLLFMILLLTYLVLVFAGQHMLVGLLGQSNGVVLVASTLAIAALFQPLRRRIQAIIDRRFYRSKYDSAKTLEAFSATLRSEVDLDQLRAHLLSVVQETMQPAHVSLWLSSPGRHTEERRRLERLEKPSTVEESF